MDVPWRASRLHGMAAERRCLCAPRASLSVSPKSLDSPRRRRKREKTGAKGSRWIGLKLTRSCKAKARGDGGDGGDGGREGEGQSDYLQVQEIPAVWRSGSIRWTYQEGQDLCKVTGAESAASGEAEAETSRAKTLFTSLFLPSDYPASVSPDYTPWLKYHLGSLFIRDVLEVLASQSLLVAVTSSQSSSLSVAAAASMSSLGPNASATMAAATKWVLKDGFGSLATLAVGSRGGQSFDEDPKRWWVVTSAMEDVARLIEICLPLLPLQMQAQWFLPGAGLATFVRSGALVGRNSLVNGTLIKHFGEGRDNLSDIRAKLEAQGRILKLASLPVGITLFRWTQTFLSQTSPGLDVGSAAYLQNNIHISSPVGVLLSLSVYSLIFGIHNFCCYKSAKSLSFTNLSAFRAQIVAKQFLSPGPGGEGGEGGEGGGGEGEVQSPEEVARMEGVYTPRQNTDEGGATIVGCSFKRFHEQSLIGLHRLESTFAKEGYVLSVSTSGKVPGLLDKEEGKEGKNWNCLVLLKTSYTDQDIMKAVLQAQIILRNAKETSSTSTSLHNELIVRKLIEDSLAEAGNKVGEFQQALVEAEWDLKVVRGAWNTVSILK